MDPLTGGVLFVLFLLAFGPAVRGTKTGIESFTEPGKPETQEEHDRANSDIVRLLVVLVMVFGLMFAMKMGG